MSDWHMPFQEVLHGLTLPQLHLLSWARTQRIKADRHWQMTVASLPLQEDPQSFYDNVMGIVDDGNEEGDREYRGSSGNSNLPFLHEISPLQAAMMGLPIQFVDVKED